MASFPTAASSQDEGTEGWQSIQSNGINYSETSKSQSPSIRFPNEEVSSSGDELTTKVRKPYTITKQRERWTEEEHQKFLEALKMHGRAWRRIEEHIGTKTAVQIRSHAQKFFSKLEREASARGVTVGKAQDISIPPPRPKRKPSHPYPRKAGVTIPSCSSANEEESRSPQAAASALDRLSAGLKLRVITRKNAAFAPYNARPSPLQTKGNLNLQETKMESSSTNISPSSLKLFGQTVVVPTNEAALGGKIKGAFQEFTSLKQEITPFEGKNTEDPKLVIVKGSLNTLSLKSQTKVAKFGNALRATPKILPSESGTSTLEGSGETNANSPCMENLTGQQDSDEQLSSELDNNTNYLSRKHQASVTIPSYPRHALVQQVETGSPDYAHNIMKCRSNTASPAHDFAAMTMLNANGSSSNFSGQMPADIQNSLQPNFLLPFPGMPGPFNPAYNNLENFGCIPGFVAPGSVPNGPLPPWHLTPPGVLHHPAYAAATLAAAGFWPGLASGASGASMVDLRPPSAGMNGHALCDETSAAAAVTAATVAAASAWWTLHGAIPPPFLHPGIYGPVVTAMAAEAAAVAAASGSSSPGCKTEPVTEARKQEEISRIKEDNKISDALPTNPRAKADRKVSMQELDDGNTGLSCPKSGPPDCLPQDSPSGSDHNATSCMESCDGAMRIEKQNPNTEEKDHNAHCTNSPDGKNTTDRKFIRSSSGSNTPSSAEPETDTCLEPNIEVIKGNNEGDLEFNGNGNCSFEARVENPLTKETGSCTLPKTLGKAERERNNLSAMQDEKMDDIKKPIYKDRHQSHGGDAAGRRSKSGGHLSDTWKEVSEEGRIAFQALFARDVLPQSFSPPCGLKEKVKTTKPNEETMFNDAKQNPIIISTNEMQIDIQKRLLNESQTNNVGIQPEDGCAQELPSSTAASLTQENKLRDLEVTVSDQSVEEYGDCGIRSSPNDNVAVDFKPTKSSGISSCGNVRSGRGFVPYQRCSIEAKKSRLHTRPTQNCPDGLREGKRICLEQEVKDR